METLYSVLELIGTAAFAVSGVITALEKKLDFFGAIVLGLVTAVGGGIIRDIILGYLPPSAFRVPLYSITAIAVSATVFTVAWAVGKRIKSHFDTWAQVINIFDSVGLAVFTVGGVNAAHSCGFTENAYLCVFVGVMTAVGGGVMRDIMAGNVPMILRKRVYALASLAGALIYQLMTEHTDISRIVCVLVGISAVFIIRILATVFHWNLPKVRNLDD